ncbi:hypothetical protein F7734_05150 [Scytonema sp. UIC 10036]|uniref:hypothetical protein n=1 Tax=Scytonema sp. UIC 10036 TaxID=2304196 RepID=UPI0012DAC1EA|nr:hypothetical protein [Scytonema sp. UIC 10036]MUG91890.1 hypothetical protein [Scytonema sp. UIC 10036]
MKYTPLSSPQSIGGTQAVAGNPNTPSDVLLQLGAEFPSELLNNPVFLLPITVEAVQSLAFSPDSQTLASKSAADFKLWRVTEGKETFSRLQSQRMSYPTIAFTQSNNQSNPVLISSDFYGSYAERNAPGSSVLSGLILSKTFLKALCNQLFKHYLS